MMKQIAVMVALSASLTIGLVSTSSAKDRMEMREAAGVEAGDRVDRRSEARENVEADAGDRKEVREAAGVEAGDRVDRRSEVRESID
jgi:hypothetical protein